MKIGIVGDLHITDRVRCRTDNYLETVLGKIDYIASNNDKVICLGDFVSMYANPPSVFNDIYTLLKKHDGKFITILGNHDIFHHNYNALSKTTVGSLGLTGVLDIKMEAFEIDGTEFEVSLCKKGMKEVPVDESNTKILLGHNYYNMDTCPDESYTYDDICKLNYNIVFLGHDHKPYEEEFIGNSILIRMGSLTRIDTQEYNRDRGIYYYQWDTKTREYTRLEVPHEESEDVYLENSFVKVYAKDSNKFDYNKLSQLLTMFDKQKSGSVSLGEVLKRINTPKEYIAYIKEIHDVACVDFT